VYLSYLRNDHSFNSLGMRGENTGVGWDTFLPRGSLSSRVNSVVQNGKSNIEMNVYKVTHVDQILVISRVPATFCNEKQIAT